MTKVNRVKSIRGSLIIYSMSIILLMTVLSIYSLSIMEQYKGQIETMFERHIYLSDIENIVEEMDENLLGFLTSKSSTKLNSYNISKGELKEYYVKKPIELVTMNDVLLKNIENLLEEYVYECDTAILNKRQRNVSKYYEHYEVSERIKSYILDYIDLLNEKQLSLNSSAYIELVTQMKLLQTITYFIIVILIALAFAIVYYVTSRMLRPLTHLSQAAEEIATGNFDTDNIVVESEDELYVMATAFNKMKNSIRDYVDELTVKAETEAKLKDEQMKNLKMEHLLDNARLYALQSQINPHFLFNTINAGVQMSIMERATNTGQFLETMSRLFRYNIQKMDSTCTLSEEIQNIKDYYDLLKVRFGSRITFKFNIDPTTLEFDVPPLILQPIVENAYIHGLSGLEQGGTITIQTSMSSDYIYIVVEDTGKGMSSEMIDILLSKNSDRTSIGVRNVIERLELFFHMEDVVSIESQLGVGVKFTIKIPNDRV